MNIEKLITDTFSAHEHVVPDSESVYAAARQRIDSRRSGFSRPLAVAGGATVVTLAAAAVVVLNRPGPGDQPQVPAAVDEAKGNTTTSAQAKGGIQDLKMPYSLGWLPEGTVAYQARRIHLGGDPNKPLPGGEYMLTVTANGQVLEVDVQHMRSMPVDAAAFKSGPGQPVTINGQRGVESSVSTGPGGYELYVAHPDGGSLYINVANAPGSKAPAQQLIDDGHKIAQNIHFPGNTTVTPSFGLRDLPSGMGICAFDVEQPIGEGPLANGGKATPSTSYQVGTCTEMPKIGIGSGNVRPPTGTPGKPVQGHKTLVSEDKGYNTLGVLDAVHGDPVTIAGNVSQDELYDIANRLVLPK